VDGDKQRAFLTAMAGQHDGKLRRFLESRLRNAVADVPDLMQEVFLRLMRVPDPDSIRTPEAYLFTVAKAVLHQHRARKAAAPEAIDIMDVLAEIQEETAVGPEGQLDAEQRLVELQRALAQLPRKAYVTLVLNRIVGMPLGEIGQQLGISRPMAKKYLAKALSTCRQHDQEIG
jgi:RNA polymerase sigma factor (sigma-70 family)